MSYNNVTFLWHHRFTNLQSNILKGIHSFVCVCMLSHSVMSDSLWPHGLYPARLLCPWNFPGKNTGMGCHFLLQGIFLPQGLNPCLLHWQVDSLPLCHLESPLVCFKLCLSSTQLWSTVGLRKCCQVPSPLPPRGDRRKKKHIKS